MAIPKICLASNILPKIPLFLMLVLSVIGCSRGALQGSEKDLGNGFILYYITDTGKRIEYEGNKRKSYTAVSNTVDGFYNSNDYIFVIRNPSDNTKLDASYEERYNKPCEFIMIDKNTHEKKKFSGWNDFVLALEENSVNISNLSFTFEKKNERSCRPK